MISKKEGLTLGFLAGLVTALLGAYKDTTFEEFKPGVFWRSPMVASVWGALGATWFPENKSKILLTTFAATCERISVESWKAVSGNPPGKFSWGEDRDRGWLLKKQPGGSPEVLERKPIMGLR